MTPRYSIALAIAVGFALVVSPAPRLRAASLETAPTLSPDDSAATTLESLAQQRFGADLTDAERTLLRSAPRRKPVWLGPDENPDNPANDAGHGDRWGPERSVRADLVMWLVTDAQASRLVHPSGLGLFAGRIDGKLDLSYASVDKPITIVRCYLPGGIDLSSAHLDDFEVRLSNTGAIAANMATIHGDVSFMTGNYASASFFRAHIDGNLDFSGSRVMNAAPDAVSVVESTIGGDLTFHDGFTTDGIIDARLATIGRALDFHNVEFQGDGGLDAERAIIAGTFYWTEVKHTPKTTLDLENTHASAIWDDAASWPAPGNLTISGFSYGEIAGGPGDAPERLRWLGLQQTGYRPQPYRQLAKVLTEAGRENGATTVRIAKEIAQRRFGHMSRFDRAWSLMLEYTIGFGYLPLRALWWIAGFVGLGTILFGWGYRLRIITPTEASAYTQFVATGEAPPHYPVFNPIVYSLENFLPVVELHQDKYWRPNPRHAVRGKVKGRDEPLDASGLPSLLLRWYLWIHILAGWTITPLLFAGLSGLVRPD